MRPIQLIQLLALSLGLSAFGCVEDPDRQRKRLTKRLRKIEKGLRAKAQTEAAASAAREPAAPKSEAADPNVSSTG